MRSVTLLSCADCPLPILFEASRSAVPPLHLQASGKYFEFMNWVSAAPGLPPPLSTPTPSSTRN